MDFRILGPIEVLDGGRAVALGGSRQRALLAVLLLHANETLSTDRLIDELYGERPPATAAKSVQVQVSRLRKALGNGRAEVLVTREHGYQLALDRDRLDAHRFERLVADAKGELAAGRAEQAAETLRAALALWRGTPLADLSYEPFAQREIARLADLQVVAQELLMEARLALAEHAEAVGELEALIAEHPYRERLRAQLMLALYRSDRQADALQAYQDARRKLVEELGIEPGERLRELERAVLAQDPALALPIPGPAAPPPPPEPAEPAAEPAAPPDTRSGRRLVSIVFADLVGSTGLAERLDPESMHSLLDRVMDVCVTVVERHGGSVEGFIGDAVVGVFGFTELHEDDALRAVRAAVELRAASAALSDELERERDVGIALKFGIEAGEVFLGGGARRSPFAAGDAFNVAARLEGLASAGEILIGECIHPLVKDAIRSEPLEPLVLKGRTAPVRAHRLVELVDDPSRLAPPASAFVGRGRELSQLQAAFERVCGEAACHAVTVVGPAGIGKSRLVQELAATLADEANVVVGRCLSYGDGVTYRPLAEIVRQLGGPERVDQLLEGEEALAQSVLAAVGLLEGAGQAEETFWAARRLFERAAAERPLVAVVEDVHWAEPTLLDLLEHVVAFSAGHPILLVCIARPEFVETRPGWVAPQPNMSLLTLEALSEDEARKLLDAASDESLDSRTAAQIMDTAEGNPLFLEQLLAVGAEPGGDLPSTIQAVLAARIDHLAPAERELLEHASVQGPSFQVVPELLGERVRVDVATDLISLVRKQLIRAERSEFPGQDAFRFAHALIREAAYQGLSRRRRADLHEGVARWLQTMPGSHDERVGYHLGEAHRQLVELGGAGERERALAASAAERLAAAGDAAFLRGDAPAGARLLERAAALQPDDPALLPRLGAALLGAGRLADADRVLGDAIDRAGDDDRLASRARVERQLVRLQSGASSPEADSARVAEEALAVLEAHGDDLGQCRALYLDGVQAWLEGRVADADEAWRRAAEHARAAGDTAALFEILDWRASAAAFGPTPVPEAIRRCQEIAAEVERSPVAVARVYRPLCALTAMRGDFEEARRLVRAGDEVLGELGGLDMANAQQEALVEVLADRPAEVEARLRPGYDKLAEMGEKALLATAAVLLADAVDAQGRHDEAGELCRVSEETAAADDLSAQVGWRTVRARLLARDGRLEEAEALAAEAVRLAERTDFLADHAAALIGLGTVLLKRGRGRQAGAAIDAAIELYERKGDVVSARRARALRDQPTEVDGEQVQ